MQRFSAGGAYSAPPDSMAAFTGPIFLRGGKEKRRVENGVCPPQSSPQIDAPAKNAKRDNNTPTQRTFFTILVGHRLCRTSEISMSDVVLYSICTSSQNFQCAGCFISVKRLPVLRHVKHQFSKVTKKCRKLLHELFAKLYHGANITQSTSEGSPLCVAESTTGLSSSATKPSNYNNLRSLLVYSRHTDSRVFCGHPLWTYRYCQHSLHRQTLLLVGSHAAPPTVWNSLPSFVRTGTAQCFTVLTRDPRDPFTFVDPY